MFMEITKEKYNKKNLLVQKSNPLLSLSQSELTLPELKILDTYLSRINSHKPDEREVVLEKTEFEELLGVTQLRTEDLQLRVEHLIGKSLLRPGSKKNDYEYVTLFRSIAVKKNESGKIEITLKCSEEAMKYFFNIEHLGYLKYKLHFITSLKSRYSYFMFLYLWSNKDRISWEIDLDELKVLLNCNKEEAYKEFKIFNRAVLKRIQSEINNGEFINYDYDLVKSGRTVTKIKFTVNNYIEKAPDKKKVAKEKTSDWHGLELTDKQIITFDTLLSLIPDHKLPKGASDADRRNTYVSEKVKEIEDRSASNEISDKAAYFEKIMRNDIQSTPASNKPVTKNKFNNINQRQYDFEELEKKLISNK